MSRSTRRARVPVGLLAGLGVGAALTACRPESPRAPRVDVRDWSLDDIEAQLDRNGEMLADAGIVIAAADPGQLATKAQPAPSDPGGGGEVAVEEEPIYDYDDMEDAAPPEPEPAPTVAASEPMVDEADMEEAPVAESRRRRRRSERRSSSQRERAPTRCERVCDLADATCELEAQICDLAARHPEQDRYQRACERAELQCEAAMEACERCDDE